MSVTTYVTEEKKGTVGSSVIRIDAIEKVTGQATFAFDMTLPNMLHGKIKRSSYPHAKIIEIDTSRAEGLPGVATIVTAKDIPANARFGAGLFDEVAFARDVVRYVGEPLAAVAAETEAIAEEALELIKVEYEELPAVFDPEEAMKENPKVVVHPDIRSYKFPAVHPPRLVPGRPNVGNYHKIYTGDVEKGFKESDLVVENKFSTAALHHCFMETIVALAKPESDGGVTVWTSHQAVPVLKQLICDSLGLSPDKVRVIVPYVGGGFGAKTAVAGQAQPACVALALKAKRPVRIALTREEVLFATNCRFPYIIRVKDGVKKDGTLVARQIHLVLNMGAYCELAYLQVRNCAYGAAATYKIPNFKLDSYGVYTNQVKAGPLRGFGTPEVCFAIETQMNIIAEKLGIDAVELRLKNLLKEGDVNVIGEEMFSVGSRECLEKVAKAIEWGKPSEQPPIGSWRRGKGIAVANKYSLGPTASSAVVRILPDGVVQVSTQATELGQGCHTVLAQIAAQELKVPMEKVKLVTCDSLTTPYGAGAWSSRQSYNDGNAVRLACIDAKRELLRLAAKKLNCSPESLDYEDGRILVKDGTQSIPLTELYTDHLWNTKFLDEVGEIIGRATFHQLIVPMDENGHSPRSCSFYMHNAQAVEVEVNVRTGQTRVLRYASAADCGKALNPVNMQQQIEGGMSMGIGTTLMEEMVIKNGRVVNTDYLDYKLPTSLDHPTVGNMIPIIVEAPHREGPYGAKGGGEVTLVAAAPAISGAIYNAVGARCQDLPITAEKIFKALKARAR